MRAHVEHDMMQRVNVWLIEDHWPGGPAVLRLDRPLGEDAFEPLPEGRIDVKPTISMHLREWRVLLDAVNDIVTPDRMAAEAIADARGTRDRLLAMVEGLVARGALS